MVFDFDEDEIIVIAGCIQRLVEFDDGTKYNSQVVGKRILKKIMPYLTELALKKGYKKKVGLV